MKNIILNIGTESFVFMGKTKAEALERASVHLGELTDDELNGASFEIGYKEEVKIVKNDDGQWEGEGQWRVEYVENGCGSVDFYDERGLAIDSFISKAGVDGEHWVDNLWVKS